jgi:radical SAM superfamily enzyme YgiQ (UPF0313 family)
MTHVGRHNPDYIAFSFVTEDDYLQSLPFAREAKHKGYKTIAGGVYVKKGAYIDRSLFNHVCQGEGERLPDFLLKGDESALKGHVHKDLDDLPLPDYSGVTGYEFNRPSYGFTFLNGLKIIPYSSSRGCTHRCSFCDVRLWNKPLRIKHTIKADLDYLFDRHNPDMFYILDELMPYHKKEWLDQWEGNKYPFSGMIRADIEPDTLHFLIDNGLRACVFGIESGDEEYRNRILKKDLRDVDIHRTVELLKSRGIIYAPFYMSGTPYETVEIRQKTIHMKNQVGGYSVEFPYRDMDKKVFKISEATLDKYCKKSGSSKEDIKDILNDPNCYIHSNGDNFIIYQLIGNDILFIAGIYGDGQYFDKILQVLTKSTGRTKVLGVVKRPKAFIKKWGFDYCSTLIERRY